MRAGALDRRISLQRAGFTSNDWNEQVPSWNELAEVWAEVTYKTVREALAGQQVAATLITRFNIRWSNSLADLSPNDRIVYNGWVYDIFGVYEIGRLEGLEIHAVARSD